jgi:L-fuculose-phosphate aldolase
MSFPAADEDALRNALLATTREAEVRGLNHNSTGNLSVRCGNRALVTPSGIPAERMTANDMVLVNLDGSLARDGQPQATSELLLHLAVYVARPDVGAIVHTHSPEATAAACNGRTLPALHYVMAKTGDTELQCAPYATYGSAELAEFVADTLGATRHACLMSNHGAIALGKDLDAALALAHDIEWFCGIARRAFAWGNPVALPDDEIARIARLFSTYGQPRLNNE